MTQHRGVVAGGARFTVSVSQEYVRISDVIASVRHRRTRERGTGRVRRRAENVVHTSPFPAERPVIEAVGTTLAPDFDAASVDVDVVF